MTDTTAETVRRIICDVFDTEPEKVHDRAAFIDDLGGDSLDWIELIMAIECEFDIEICDDEAEAVATKTVGDAITAIKAKLAG